MQGGELVVFCRKCKRSALPRMDVYGEPLCSVLLVGSATP